MCTLRKDDHGYPLAVERDGEPILHLRASIRTNAYAQVVVDELNRAQQLGDHDADYTPTACMVCGEVFNAQACQDKDWPLRAVCSERCGAMYIQKK